MEKWVERQSERKRDASTDHDYFYRIDKSRIINSMAFRRLQAKTQVHQVGESDFFRTRLTHSMEVAQIGATLVHILNYKATNSELDFKSWIPSISLIETICLAHDLGHPAFGHNGERTLNFFMHKHGGFEGNGQTFRILTKLGEFSSGFGYNLTRRTLLGVLKYPAAFSDLGKDYSQYQNITPIDISNWSPPKCIHDTEIDALNWVLSPLSDQDKTLFSSIEEKKGKRKTIHKSFDASIMECADDIAYGIHDLEDALVMGLVSSQLVCEKLENELKKLSLIVTRKYSKQSDSYLSTKLCSNKIEDIKTAISSIINVLTHRVEVHKKNVFESPLLDYQAKFNEETDGILSSFKDFVYEEVIAQPHLQTLEYKGQKILSDLFGALKSKPFNLLPSIVQKKIDRNETNIDRVICDYLASMTDNEACRLYERLFTPNKGSIFMPLI